MRLCANLSMMFNEVPFLDRFEAARAAGFEGVEYLFPYDHPATEIRSRLDGNGLTQVLFNMPPGDWAAGERGTASLPGRTAEFRDGVMRALDYAGALGCGDAVGESHVRPSSVGSGRRRRVTCHLPSPRPRRSGRRPRSSGRRP